MVTRVNAVRFRVACLLAVLVVAGGLLGPATSAPRHRASRLAAAATPNNIGTAGLPAPAPAWHPRQFTVLAAGDVLLHSGFWYDAAAAAATPGRSHYNFDPVFSSAVPDIARADLAICHLETPLGQPAGPFSGYPIFNVPPQIAGTLARVGYDDCDTASNHTIDKGLAGVQRTLAALDAAGISHTGSARSAAEAAQLDLLHVNGVTVAHLAYTFSFNGLPLPKGEPWLANALNVRRILADAHRAKQAGAEVVIVTIHWGTEYVHAPNQQQLTVARQLLASPDVDLIVGCHVHVVQPLQEINGKWVAYGMGNQVAWQPFRQDTRDGVMPRFTFTEMTPGHFIVTKTEVIPTYMRLGPGPARLIDLPRALADPHLSAGLRAEYLASWRRTAGYVRGVGVTVLARE
jgi:poly-gamma-glutamate capsule biosynthesis protein CapA/YwtB (metallophosphatase superfamily)